jgi:DNA-binding MarR family transcriptional regulator
MPSISKAPLPDEYFMLWILLAQNKDAMLKARERDYARYGISNERRAVLYIIQNNGGSATPVEIARDLFRELHSVTEMLKRMEKDGLINRYKGSGRSKVEVGLTEKGIEVFNQSLHNETDKRIFSVLTKIERERLAAYLFRLRSKILEDLGIPEWHLNFPLNPNWAKEEAAESLTRGNGQESISSKA